MKSCLDETDGCYVMMEMTVSWRKERSRIEWSGLDEKSHEKNVVSQSNAAGSERHNH